MRTVARDRKNCLLKQRQTIHSHLTLRKVYMPVREAPVRDMINSTRGQSDGVALILIVAIVLIAGGSYVTGVFADIVAIYCDMEGSIC